MWEREVILYNSGHPDYFNGDILFQFNSIQFIYFSQQFLNYKFTFGSFYKYKVINKQKQQQKISHAKNNKKINNKQMTKYTVPSSGLLNHIRGNENYDF